MKRVWFGKRLMKGKIALSPQDRGLTLGDGVFETIAVTGSVPLWRFEHVERMRAAAGALGIAFPEDEVENAIDALTHKARGHHVLRLTLTRGEAARGLAGPVSKPTLVGNLQPFEHSLRFQPVSLATSSVRRSLQAPSTRLKTLSYVDNVAAAREAAAAGADDALMLNSAGRVACSSIGNIFIEAGGVLTTPTLSEGILPGIMRAAVIAAARRCGVRLREKPVKASDVIKADCVWVSNSLRFVRPVTRLDKTRYGIRSKVMDGIIRCLLEMEQEQIVID
jgi:branched-chain amino acid aminotransferase